MIDTDKLPTSAMIDTGVLMRFLGEQPQDPRAPLCKAFCEEMLNIGRTLYVAAPTVAEIVRQRGNPVPRTKGIVVVPFDGRAADILGQHMPMSVLKQAQSAAGLPLVYIKYDALIMACVKRCNAPVIVTLDPRDHSVLAQGLGIAVREPRDYARSSPMQMPIVFPAVQGSPPASAANPPVSSGGAPPSKDASPNVQPTDSHAKEEANVPSSRPSLPASSAATPSGADGEAPANSGGRGPDGVAAEGAERTGGPAVQQEPDSANSAGADGSS